MSQQIARLRAERAARARQSDSYRALDELARNRDPKRYAELCKRAFPNRRPRTAMEKLGAKAGTAAGMSGALSSFN